jgi:hypothetical protein
MHKDPPPTLLEKSTAYIVLHGITVGFIASLIFFGAWALFTADKQSNRVSPMPLPSPNTRAP